MQIHTNLLLGHQVWTQPYSIDCVNTNLSGDIVSAVAEAVSGEGRLQEKPTAGAPPLGHWERQDPRCCLWASHIVT